MYRRKTIGALIVAAGFGTRMGGSLPKQFLEINGRPLSFMAAETFASMEVIDEVVFVTREDYVDYSRKELPFARVVEGGSTRSESVFQGLEELASRVDYVLVHDGARPFITPEVIERVIEKTLQTGAALCAVSPKDTIRTRRETLVRDELYCVQTPQGFDSTLLLQAYQAGREKGYQGTDDAGLVEALGHEVALVLGDYENIKITTKEDLPMETKVGMGYDVHRLVPQRDLILGGVKLPFERGLLGHSDADVLLHSIMDGLLGALGEGDIGRWFPDDDPRYEGISSLKLLEQVGVTLKEKGYAVEHIDATLMGQRPKIAPYVASMKKNIADALQIKEYRINIKGTTTEGLGFIGREEGLAAQAICTIKK